MPSSKGSTTNGVMNLTLHAVKLKGGGVQSVEAGQ